MENKEIKDEKNLAEEKEQNIEVNKENDMVQEKQLSEFDAEEEKKLESILEGVLNTNVSKIIKRELVELPILIQEVKINLDQKNHILTKTIPLFQINLKKVKYN